MSKIMDNFFAFMGVFLGSVLIATLVIVGSILQVAKHYDHQNCPHRGEAWNLPTKFVSYSTFSYDCLVKIGDKWIPVNQYNGVVIDK